MTKKFRTEIYEKFEEFQRLVQRVYDSLNHSIGMKLESLKILKDENPLNKLL